MHAQSGCMYDATLEGQCVGIAAADDTACGASADMGKQACEGTGRCTGGATTPAMLDQGACEADGGTWSAARVCQTGVQSKYAVWRYSEPSPESNPEDAALCGHVDTPTDATPLRGSINIDYIPGVSDASDKCVCESCFMTQTDYNNRNAMGGYAQYCNLNVCTEAGVVAWGPSVGTELVIVSDTAGRGECDDSAKCKTFAELAALTGASPEILIAFAVVSGLLVLYCLVNVIFDKGGDEADSDDEDSAKVEDGE